MGEVAGPAGEIGDKKVRGHLLAFKSAIFILVRMWRRASAKALMDGNRRSKCHRRSLSPRHPRTRRDVAHSISVQNTPNKNQNKKKQKKTNQKPTPVLEPTSPAHKTRRCPFH